METQVDARSSSKLTADKWDNSLGQWNQETWCTVFWFGNLDRCSQDTKDKGIDHWRSRRRKQGTLLLCLNVNIDDNIWLVLVLDVLR